MPARTAVVSGCNPGRFAPAQARGVGQRPLVYLRAMENRQRAEPGSRWVTVLETNDQFQFALAKGLLEDAGIPLFIQGQLATLYQSLDGFLRKWVRVQVPEDRVAEAQELLEQVLTPRPYLC